MACQCRFAEGPMMANTTQVIDFIVDIDARAYSPNDAPSYGLKDGHFRWCYGNSFTASISGPVVGGILSGMDSIESSVDISETGGFFTDSSFSCAIQNSLNFENLLDSYAIRFVGLPIVVSYYNIESNVERTLWTGQVSAWSTGETEINISASVEALVPSGDLQNSIIDAERFPAADADVFGTVVPAVFGDVEYSPAVLLNKAGAFISGPFFFDASNAYWSTTVPPGHFVIKTQPMTLAQYGLLTSATNPSIVFVNGYGSPTRTYRIVGYEGILPAIYANLLIAGTIDATGHNWDGSANSNTSPWFYNIADVESSSKASDYAQYGFGPYAEADSMSFYDSGLKQYTRSIGIVKDISATGDVSYYAKPRSDYTDNPLTFTAQRFDKEGMNNGFMFSWRPTTNGSGSFTTIDPPTTGTYEDIYDRDQSTEATFDIAFHDPSPRAIDVMLTAYGLDASLFKKGSRAFICFDFYNTSGNNVTGKYVNIVAKHNGVEVGVFQTVTAIDFPLATPIQYVPREFYSSSYTGYDNFEKLINAEYGHNYYEIPEYLIDAIVDGLYTEIDLYVTYLANAPYTHGGGCDISDTYHVNGISIVSSIGEIERGATPYISTEGETVGDDGTTKTNSMQNAVLHIVEDYAGSTATVPTTGVGTLHVGRTITEPIKVQDCLDSLLKQAFAVGRINRLGQIDVASWLDAQGTTPVVAFTVDNIIRDSISQWTTTPTNRTYNSFLCAYDYDFETDKYRSTMAINNPSGTFPAITGAWDKYVSGIGSGSDTAAYAEALDAWGYCSSGYEETGALRAYSKSNAKLSWFSDPSWLGTPVDKIDLSAWYFLKKCAYWLSAPRREAKFRVSLDYVNQIDILDYCTFQDYIVTNNDVYYGWITSLSIDREGITVGMSMDRRIPMKDSIRERGVPTVADDVYTETGIQTIEEDIITESGI